METTKKKKLKCISGCVRCENRLRSVLQKVRKMEGIISFRKLCRHVAEESRSVHRDNNAVFQEYSNIYHIQCYQTNYLELNISVRCIIYFVCSILFFQRIINKFNS